MVKGYSLVLYNAPSPQNTKEKISRKAISVHFTVGADLSYSDASSLEEDRDCDALACIISEAEDDALLWIACSRCGRWFHLYCVYLDEPVDEFICNHCYPFFP